MFFISWTLSLQIKKKIPSKHKHLRISNPSVETWDVLDFTSLSYQEIEFQSHKNSNTVEFFQAISRVQRNDIEYI